MFRLLVSVVAAAAIVAAHGCSKSPAPTVAGGVAPNAKAAPKESAKPKIPTISEQQRQELTIDLDQRIKTSEANWKELIELTGSIEAMNQMRPANSVEEIAKRQATQQRRKEGLAGVKKDLVEYTVIRGLVDISPKRQHALRERIIERYRVKLAPMYERSYVVEKVGKRADQPAVQLARDVSNKVVFGWYERYDVKFMVEDSEEFTKTRIEEIVDGMAK